MKVVSAAIALAALTALASFRAEAAPSTDGKSLPPTLGVASPGAETAVSPDGKSVPPTFGVALPHRLAAASLAKLAGPWAATIVGSTDCGLTTMYVTFNLDGSGTGNASTTMHTASCGDGMIANQIHISSLNSNGAGNAALSNDGDPGWNLTIQVMPGSKLFSLVDVSSGDRNNFIGGTAIHQ